MEQVTFTNANGESIVWATDSATYRLRSFDMTPLVDTPQTSQGYQQEGYSYEEAHAEARDGIIRCTVFGTSFADMYEKRREIKRIMNPKLGEGMIVYVNDYITEGWALTVKVDAEPNFPTDGENFGSNFMFGSVSITAYEPYWHDIDDTEVDFFGLTDAFYWETPTYFDGAFYLGEVSSASKNVTNIGDVPAPLTIEWTGAATNPKITLENTGEYILLIRVLTSDEKLIITTGYGEKNVYIQTISTGAITEDFSIVDEDSDLYMLPVGTSTISLSADSGASTAAVKIKYKNQYIGG